MSSFEWIREAPPRIFQFPNSNPMLAQIECQFYILFNKNKFGLCKIFFSGISVDEGQAFVELWPICVLLVSIYLTCDSTYHQPNVNFHIFLCRLSIGIAEHKYLCLDPFLRWPERWNKFSSGIPFRLYLRLMNNFGFRQWSSLHNLLQFCILWQMWFAQPQMSFSWKL